MKTGGRSYFSSQQSSFAVGLASSGTGSLGSSSVSGSPGSSSGSGDCF